MKPTAMRCADPRLTYWLQAPLCWTFLPCVTQDANPAQNKSGNRPPILDTYLDRWFNAKMRAPRRSAAGSRLPKGRPIRLQCDRILPCDSLGTSTSQPSSSRAKPAKLFSSSKSYTFLQAPKRVIVHHSWSALLHSFNKTGRMYQHWTNHRLSR